METKKKSVSTRKPQLNIALEAEEKAVVEAVAKARHISVSSLVRLLAFEEARRLGIATPGEAKG